MIKLAILDDIPLHAELLAEKIQSFEGVEVVAHAQNSDDFLALFSNQNIDLALVDIELPGNLSWDGFQVATWLKSHHPKTKILAMSVNVQSHVLRRMLDDIGAHGFLDRNKATTKDLEQAIDTIMNNSIYVHQDMADRALRVLKLDKLTSRECEVIKFVINGHSNVIIGDLLGISKKTVDNHRQNIYRKMRCRNVGELAQHYFRYLYLHGQDLDQLPNFKKQIRCAGK